MALVKQFIKIQKMRYRVSSIKRYEPFERKDGSLIGIYVFFSMTGKGNKVYHLFDSEKERDDMLLELDKTFGV